jgi:50S ribosomal subunit-associated GTPase HflX
MDIVQELRVQDDDVPISATKGQGIDMLVDCIEAALFSSERSYEVTVPYDRADVEHQIHSNARVDRKEYLEEGVRMYFTGSAQVFAQALDSLSQPKA